MTVRMSAKVQVHEPGRYHQVGNATHAHVKDVVGHLERFLPAGFLVGQPEEILIGNDDQRVHVLLQLGNACIGRPCAAHALEGERLGHHAHGENAALACHARNDRSSAGAGAAAHAGGDEHHVRAVEMPGQFVSRFFCRRTADFGLRTGAEALCEMGPELDAPVGAAVHQLLRVGVGDNEIHALQIELDHVVDSVRAAATHPDDRDARCEIGVQGLWNGEVQGHGVSPCWRYGLSAADLTNGIRHGHAGSRRFGATAQLADRHPNRYREENGPLRRPRKAGPTQLQTRDRSRLRQGP